jgi:putative ABC transport system substrate-binding protein
MKRRDFITLLGGAAAAWPLAAPAQQPRMLRVGFVGIQPRAAAIYVAFLKRMAELGYQEGRNFTFEYIQAPSIEGYEASYRALLTRRVDILLAAGNELSLRAARAVAGTLPIAFLAIDFDLLAAGDVASLARPGGNITGLTSDASREIQAKNLTLLKEMIPSLSRVALLGEVMSQDGFAALEAAARQLNLTLEIVDSDGHKDLENAFTVMVSKHVGAVIIGGGPLTYQHRQQIADLALKHRLPAIHVLNEYPRAGLLMSYGPDLADLYRRAASYVVKILRGAKPGVLPVEQPTKLQLVINLKSAKALGLAIPQSLLLRADEVIQ